MNPKKRSFRYYTYIEPVIKAPFVKSYGFPILTIVAVAIFAVFAIKPTVETIVSLQKDLANQEEILAKATKKSGDLSAAVTNYRAIENQKLASIQTSIPDNPKVQSIISSLEGAAKVPQASISAIQFQPISYIKSQDLAKMGLSEVQFTYNIEGTFDSLKRVLQNLGTSQRLITIDIITINKLEGGKGLLMSVVGKAYYLK